jgi:ATP-dependent Lon protease
MSEQKTLPVIPLRGTVVFPGVALPISVGRSFTLRAVEEATKTGQPIFAITQQKDVDKPGAEHLFRMGVIARIVQIQPSENGFQLVIQGEERAVPKRFGCGRP